MKVQVITDPVELPASLTKVKEHLHIDHSADDQDLLRKIAAATAWCEESSGLDFVRRTRRLVLDRFPTSSDRDGEAIVLPRPPLLSVTSIKYIDVAGVQQTLDAAEYYVDILAIPGRIIPAFEKRWPHTRTFVNVVEVEYVSGYGDAADVDDRAIQAMMLVVGDWYLRREDNLTVISRNTETAARQLLRQIWHGRIW